MTVLLGGSFGNALSTRNKYITSLLEEHTRIIELIIITVRSKFSLRTKLSYAISGYNGWHRKVLGTLSKDAGGSRLKDRVIIIVIEVSMPGSAPVMLTSRYMVTTQQLVG